MKFIRKNGRIIPILKDTARGTAAMGALVVAAAGVTAGRKKLFEKVRGKGKTGTGNGGVDFVLDSTATGVALHLLSKKFKQLHKGFQVLGKVTSK